jgi:integrase
VAQNGPTWVFLTFWHITGTVFNVTGRPRRQEVIPYFNKSRKRWILDIPEAEGRKRQRFSYKNQQDALLEAARVSVQIATGSEVKALPSTSGLKVSTLASAYLSDRKKETSPDNYTTLAWGLRIISEKFGDIAPDHVTPAMVSGWVKTLTNYSTRGRFNIFAVGRTFYNWPQMRDLVTVNPFRDPPLKKDKNARLPILTPDEMKKLIAANLKPFFKAWVVAGAFSGLRSCEYERISYENIDYTHKEIVIREEQSKQGNASRPRDIPIYPAFERHMPRGTGPLDGGVSWKRMQDEMSVALKVLGWKKWKKNCLRHSFASYALAQSRDPSKTAYEMGHESPKLLFSTYANKVSRSDSSAWWEL